MSLSTWIFCTLYKIKQPNHGNPYKAVDSNPRSKKDSKPTLKKKVLKSLENVQIFDHPKNFWVHEPKYYVKQLKTEKTRKNSTKIP